MLYSMLCVTGVYLRDITTMNFSILHWNVSRLLVFSRFFFLLFLCFRALLVLSTASDWVIGGGGRKGGP